ncbi:hypothetical protein F9U64_02900 [Gracilibacillus oryzae]|uniref:DUF6884 domain-containing protein n=1 Tax=Gracilibacillus oryzae TaxID=1672701 RepID=A0A7C8GV06_9BACI|nr:DUF6884 domain-containing protein [Gracilibacillus oryzae]KAB8138580.1 hypothetical protein F9U64_02900 [Gracilibacillus oryzae]
MDKLCVLPCGKKKIWDKYPDKGAIRADDAYIGVLRQLTLKYSRKFVPNRVTISAKHGFLLPDDLVRGNYDLTFQRNNPAVISVSELRSQLIDKQLDHYRHIVVLTGKKYRQIMETVFVDADIIEFPLLGTKGIGEMQSRLKESIQKGIPLHIEKGGEQK